MYSNLLPNEPVIMPWQAYPFNNDHFICEKFLELKKEFEIITVIECGSAMGGTTKWLSENFDNVVTTEINPEFAKFCMERVKDKSNVEMILGDTVSHLERILNRYRSGVMLFLDDHWLENLPLLHELQIIAESERKPVIAIHDWKVPGHPELGFDSYNGQDFEWEWIKESVEKIYGVDGYIMEYNSEAAGAKRGIIYLMPKR